MKIRVNPKASEWILKQPWLSQFINNCVADDASPDQILRYLLGEESDNVVNHCLYWVNTPEGEDFWSRIHEEISKVSKEENWNDFNTTIEI